MSSLAAPLNSKQRQFLKLLATYQPETAGELLPFLPATDSQVLQEHLGDLAAEAGVAKGGGDKTCMLYQAHPDWIGEALKEEGPAVVGCLLPKFPKSSVGSILKDLPKETRRDLKKVKLKKISPSIRALVQAQVERRFPSLDLSGFRSDEVLQKVSELSGARLLRLMEELGISEMVRAFSQVQRSTLRMILNRLGTKDAKELKSRLEDNESFPKTEQKEAQMYILGLDLDRINPEQLILEIGFGVFARAFGPGDSESSTYFTYRLPPPQGQHLRRYLEESTPAEGASGIRAARARLFDAYTRLKKEFS